MSILPRSILPLQDTLASRGAKATWGLMPHRLIESANADGQLAKEIILSHNKGHEISQHGLIHICQICGRSDDFLYDVPINSEYTWALKRQNFSENLTNAIQEIKKVQQTSGIYVLMMHDPLIRLGYENGITLEWMGALLDSLNAYYGSRIHYKTLTEAAKIFDSELSTSNTNEASYTRTQPTGISLLPNYPNPFNPTTKIGFHVSKDSPTSISVVTMEGKKISLITNQPYRAGEHWVPINLQDMASGNYLLLVQSNLGSRSRVISLIK
jgi:hypothetical protein